MGPVMLMSFFYVSHWMGARVSHTAGWQKQVSSCVCPKDSNRESDFLIQNKRKRKEGGA